MRDRLPRFRPRAAGALLVLATTLAAPAARAQLGLAASGDSSGLAPTMPPGFALEDVTGGAPFNQPVAIAFAPGARMFVAEKDGVVWLVRDGVRQPGPLLDLNREVLSNIERGLLGIAVDPGFEENGYIYLNYSVDHDGTGDWDRTDAFARVTRYTVTFGDPDTIDPASRFVLLGETFSTGIPACFVSHSPAMLAFGSDGTLLVGTGDAATFGVVDAGGLYPDCFGPDRLDPSEDIGAFRAQRIESLAGKILRIDPATGLGLPSNPFFTGDSTDNASRVWAYGVRNSFRFAVRDGGSPDPDSARPGTIVGGDVGWRVWEELNVIRGGEDMGWPCWEGPAPHPDYQVATPATNGCAGQPPPTLPVAWWHHVLAGQSVPPGLRGRSIIGGAFALGDRYPEPFRDRYFFGDYLLGWMAAARFDENDELEDILLFSQNMGPVVQTAFDTTSQALYMVNIVSGRIERLRHASETNNQPPEASIRAQPVEGVPPLAVSFSAADSFDPDGDSLTIDWNFGDGWFGQGVEVEHVYAINGTYEVVATVRDMFYAVTDTLQIRVFGEAPTFTLVEPEEGAAALPGETVTLRAEAFDPDGSPVVIKWVIAQVHDTHEHANIFISLEPTAQFTVPEHGEPGDMVYYRIVVSATDASGASSIEIRNLRVREPREIDVVPEAALTARVMTPVGQGNPSLEVVRDGVRPPRGETNPLLQFDTFDGKGGGAFEWVAITAPGVERFRRIEFQEGLESEAGGWFEDIGVEVRQEGAWVRPSVMHVLPFYRGSDGVTFDRYSLVFTETAGDAIRLVGEGGGPERFISVAELQAFSLRESTLPPPWTTFAVGVDAGGRASHTGGTFAMEGAGAFTSDREAFRYVYQTMDGDGTLTARLASLRGERSVAGLVLRTSLADTAAHAAILAGGGGPTFRYRAAAGAPAVELAVAGGGALPTWMRLVRTGPVVSAFTSPDGQRWTPAGAASVAPGVRAYAGLAVAGADGSTATASFDGVELDSGGAGALPPPWALAAVGPAPAGGGAYYADGTFVVAGAGAAGGREDAFHLVRQPVPTRGSITARLDEVGGAGRRPEAGLMVRGGLEPTAPFALVVARDDTLRVRWRPAPRAPAVETAGPAVPAPVWLRLAWANDAAIASWSVDGEAWTNLQPAGVDLGTTLVAGLMAAGVSPARGAAASGVFSSVLVDAGAGAAAGAAGAAAAVASVATFGVSVRPNPARDRATVDVHVDLPGTVTVDVLDVLGRRVLRHEVEAAGPGVYALPLATRGLPPGSYVARAVDGRGRQVTAMFVVAR